MIPENLPSNSRKTTYEKVETTAETNDEPVMEPVVTGRVIRRKTPFGKRMAKMFFSSDTDSVLGYLVKDVLVPALQDLVTNVISQGIEKAVYGQASPRTGYRGSARQPSTIGRPIVSYNDRYPNSRPTSAVSASITPARRPADRRDAMDIGQFILETKFEAENVLNKMFEALQQYNSVTVGSLLNLMRETAVYTDHQWGWTNLDHADIRRVPGGYLLVLPPVEDLGR